jgi:hypothetical protein
MSQKAQTPCPSLGSPFRGAIRPTATSVVPICYVRFTSTPAVRFAQEEQIPTVRRRLSERIKATDSRHSVAGCRTLRFCNRLAKGERAARRRPGLRLRNERRRLAEGARSRAIRPGVRRQRHRPRSRGDAHRRGLEGNRRRFAGASAQAARGGRGADRQTTSASAHAAAPVARPRRRAPSDHGHVLRPRRLDFAGGAARRRGLARSGGELPRRRLGRRDFARRPCAEETRRRADGAVRLSPGAGERRRARRPGGAGDPAGARRP